MFRLRRLPQPKEIDHNGQRVEVHFEMEQLETAEERDEILEPNEPNIVHVETSEGMQQFQIVTKVDDETNFESIEIEHVFVDKEENSDRVDDNNKKKQRKPFRRKAYTCAQCGAKYTTPGQLEKHLERHLRVKTKVEHCCFLCEKNFSSGSKLAEHIYKYHSPDESLKDFLCSRCGLLFFNLRQLNLHSEEAHLVVDTDFRCSYCDKSCNSKHSLTRHVHLNHPSDLTPRDVSVDNIAGKRLMCPVCNKIFATSSGISRHIRHKHVESTPKDSPPESNLYIDYYEEREVKERFAEALMLVDNLEKLQIAKEMVGCMNSILGDALDENSFFNDI